MEEFMLNDDVFEQILDFNHKDLTEEQNLLIDKLVLNEELKLRYKYNGLCKECKQPKASHNWCHCKFQQNFKNWTSGNHEVDKFIQKIQLKTISNRNVLEWIEYDRLENVEYLVKGGFGTIYEAIWKDGWIDRWDFENNKWIRSKYLGRDYEDFPVILKCLHNSQDITSDFLRELRQHLNNSFNSTRWDEKLSILRNIAQGLAHIHKYGIIHRDFHCGNILKKSHYIAIIDLGLCRPANVKPSQNECKEIYGVLPYVAPEVLRGKGYTQESDIYGFGIIAYEISISVCQGLRPKSNYKIPQLILNIIKQCWDADPLKRPKANGLFNLLRGYQGDYEIKKQIEEADKINEKLTSSSLLYTGPTLSYTTNPQAVYTSRLLDFKNLPEPKNTIDNKGDDNSFGEYSESIETIDFTKLNLDKSN